MPPGVVARAICIVLAFQEIACDNCSDWHPQPAAQSHSLIQFSSNVATTSKFKSSRDVNSSNLHGFNTTFTVMAEKSHASTRLAHDGSAVGAVALRPMRPPIGFYMFVILWLVCTLAVFACHRSEKSPDDAISHDFFSRDHHGKVYAYDNEQLLTWRVFIRGAPPMILSWRVFLIVPCVLGTAIVFGVLLFLGVDASSLLDLSRLEEFQRYLKFFTAFLLGLFMNSALGRYNASVSNFTGLLTTVKQTLWTVRLMGLSEKIVDDLERKMLLACYILDAEMHTDLSSKAVAWQSHWDERFHLLKEKDLLSDEEESKLRGKRSAVLQHLEVDMGIYSAVVWSWIAQVISKIREEPGVVVPMYVRLVGMALSCLTDVDRLKTAVRVQVPLSYAYLLSMIVHLNNITFAMCSGLEISASLMTIEGTGPRINGTTFYSAFEIFGLHIVLLMIQPLMYQSCLVIAHMLSHPFGDHIFHLPTETFVLLMHDEIKISAHSFESHRPKHQVRSLGGGPEDYGDNSGTGSVADGDDDDGDAGADA